MDGGSDPGGGSGGHEKWEDSGYILMGEPAGLTSGGCERKKRARGDSRFLAWTTGSRGSQKLKWGRLRKSGSSVVDTLCLRCLQTAKVRCQVLIQDGCTSLEF